MALINDDLSDIAPFNGQRIHPDWLTKDSPILREGEEGGLPEGITVHPVAYVIAERHARQTEGLSKVDADAFRAQIIADGADHVALTPDKVPSISPAAYAQVAEVLHRHGIPTTIGKAPKE